MDLQILKREGKPDLAYIFTPPAGYGVNLPIVMFCGGYRSDMEGTKAKHFEEVCRVRRQGYVRFDYSGHGQSGGEFKDGTIGLWFEDACDIFDEVVGDPGCIVVGSSMGGWIGLLLAHAKASQVKSFMGVAAAPDFTEEMYNEHLSDEQRAILDSEGYLEVANDYSDEPYTFTKAFFDEARDHLFLDGSKPISCPVRLFHGMQDKDVSPNTPEKIQSVYKGEDIDITLIEDGGHTLSRSEDLVLIGGMIVELTNL